VTGWVAPSPESNSTWDSPLPWFCWPSVTETVPGTNVVASVLELPSPLAARNVAFAASSTFPGWHPKGP
jgi:hypothetical protein